MASIATANNPCSYLSNKIPTTITQPKPTFTNLASKSISPSLTAQFRAILAPLSPSRNLRLFSAASDAFELGDENDSEEESREVGEGEETEAAISSRSNNGVESGRLYVGNLPYSMNASQLSQIFGEAGSVVSVEVIYDKVTDRSRGFGFVTMGSAEEAQEAIRMFDNSQVGGRTVKVNFPQVPMGGERELLGAKIRNSSKGYVDSPHKVYAGNLGWSLTSLDLKEAFADQPGILGAKVIYERDTGRSRGFGFVSFETAEAAQAALDVMNGVEVEGRPLRLNMASERAPREPVPAEADDGELLAINT